MTDTPTTLGEALPAEIARVRDDIMPVYADIGALGMFAVLSMKRDMDLATKALAEGDVIAMLRAYEELKGWKL